MFSTFQLPRHPGLYATTRLHGVASPSTLAHWSDWMLLTVFGVLAAVCSACLDLHIQRVPGHAILRVVFPIALGLAVVPRHGAGSVMGLSSLLSAVVLRFGGLRADGLGLGALTSLLATGPLLDLTLRRSRGGWKQYAAFAVAGLTSNLLALLTRGAAKYFGFESPGRRPLGEWLMQASWTYVLCGLAAGLISAMVLFYTRRVTAEQEAELPV